MTALAWLLLIIAVGIVIAAYNKQSPWKSFQTLLSGYGSAVGTVTK